MAVFVTVPSCSGVRIHFIAKFGASQLTPRELSAGIEACRQPGKDSQANNDHARNKRIIDVGVRILSLASLGGALEFYDFVVFVFFATTIGRLFFAASLPDWVRQAQAFGIFAAGYLARPVGGIVMAHFGDTRGRKRMFTLSVLLMAIPTLLIGVLPTYTIDGVARACASPVHAGPTGRGHRWRSARRHGSSLRSTPDGEEWGVAVGLLTGGLSFGILLGSLLATCLNRSIQPNPDGRRGLENSIFDRRHIRLHRNVAAAPLAERDPSV